MQCSLDARSTAQTALQVPVKRVLLPDMAPGRLALTAVRWLEFRAQVVKRPIVGGTITGIIMRRAGWSVYVLMRAWLDGGTSPTLPTGRSCLDGTDLLCVTGCGGR